MKRFAYGYEMAHDPDRIRTVAPDHARYWRGMGLPAYLGGPFADRTGGLITFAAGSLEEAESLASADPFATEGLLAASWLREWSVETGDRPTSGRPLG